MEFTAENVEKAIHQFYHDASTQQQAHQWLNEAQVSSMAWTFSWELLQPHRAPEVQFFGCSCLYLKISRFWYEIPEDQYEILKKQLFQEIAKFASGPKIVLRRLCVTLSSFVLNTIPDHWPGAVKNIISTFQETAIPNVSPTQVCLVLLELLKVLPEEFFTTHLRSYRRGVIRNELAKSLDDVLPLLSRLMSPNSPPEVYEQALRCFASWVQFGIPLLQTKDVIQQVFLAVRNESLFETAIDALTCVFSHPDIHKFPNSVHELIPHILDLGDLLQKAVEEQDMETCQGLTKLIVTAAENNSKILLESVEGTRKENAIKLVNMVLFCSGMRGTFPVGESSSDLTFGFWYILQDDIVSSDPALYAVYLQTYGPVFMSLVQVLLLKVQYPAEDVYASMNAEEKERFRCYRQDISDTMMYTYSILRIALLMNLHNSLASIVDKSRADEMRWQEIEALVFLFASIAENVDMDENTYIPQMFSMLPQIPFNNVILISTTLDTIGYYAEWITYHPDVLPHVIPLILQGMNNSEVATSATMALRDVTREGQHQLGPFTTDILTACQRVLSSGILKSRESVRLMSCVGYTLSVLPVPEIMQYLEVILGPHMKELEQLVEQQHSATVKAGIMVKLEMLVWLFGSLDIRKDPHSEEEEEQQTQKPNINANQPQPVLLIIQQILPVIQRLAVRWGNDSGVMENVFALFKRAIRTLMDEFGPLVSTVCDMLAQLYSISPHSVLLDLAKQITLLFINDDQHKPIIKCMFQVLCTKTVEVVQTDAREQTDIIEGFMLFLSQLIKKCSLSVSIFLEEGGQLLGLFHLGILGLGLPENNTVKASCSFLTELINNSYKLPQAKEVITNHGHTLVEKIMRAIGGESPRSVVDSMTEVIMALTKNTMEHLPTWLRALMDIEGFPSARVTQQQKAQFVKAILESRGTNKRKFKEAVKEFSLMCRGLYGTEYAAQT